MNVYQQVRNDLIRIATRKGYINVYSTYDQTEAGIQRVVDETFTFKREKSND